MGQNINMKLEQSGRAERISIIKALPNLRLLDKYIKKFSIAVGIINNPAPAVVEVLPVFQVSLFFILFLGIE